MQGHCLREDQVVKVNAVILLRSRAPKWHGWQLCRILEPAAQPLASESAGMICLLARCLSIDGLDSPGDCDADGLFRAASAHGSPSSMLDSAARVR